MRRVRISETVTRYFVSGHLGPRSRLLLVKPGEGLVVAAWRTGDAAEVVDGEWVSPYDDLEVVIDGVDLAPPSAILRVINGGSPRHVQPRTA